MKTFLITTDTPHHLYFAWQLAERFGLSGILLETRRLSFGWETFHPFEAQRDNYENATILADCRQIYGDFAETWEVESANSADANARIRTASPDVVMVLGSGKLHPHVLTHAPINLNLHGGNPEHYRGLDSHLWAIYHRDFDNLVITLHHVTAELDAGDTVFQTQLRPPAGSELYQLRSLNIQAATDLALLALQKLDAGGPLPSRRQAMVGRYYSAMPASLKQDCVVKYRRFTSTQ